MVRKKMGAALGWTAEGVCPYVVLASSDVLLCDSVACS